MSVIRASTLRKAGKAAGAVFVGIIALDLIATAVTLALGATWLSQ